MEQKFETFREIVRNQSTETLARLLEVNDDVNGLMARQGVHWDYVKEYDHLYIVLGQPREGMALFSGNMIVICDPETLELLSVEVPDFLKRIRDGTLPAFLQVAKILESQPTIHILPAELELLPPALPVLAEAIERELVPA